MKSEYLKLRIVPITAVPVHIFYDDGDTGVDDTGDNGDGNEPPPEPVVDNKNKSKVKFDPDQQKYVNSLLAEERRKGAEKNNQLITQLETQRNQAGTTAAEKQALEERIETLRSEYASKDELAKKSTDKQIKELKAKQKEAEDKAAKWEKLFQADRINNALLGAATEHKAYNPSQVVTLLKENTRLVEVLDDDGKPVPDRWAEKVKINSKDKDGKAIVLELTATEAVRQLTEMPEYGNLFISGANGGLGGNHLSKGNGGNSDQPPTETNAYMAWRAERKKKGLPV